jgi:hypothetical protein
MSGLFVFGQISHEVSVQGGGGLSTLINKYPAGKNQLGGGGEFGFGYTCFFIKTVGLRIGVDFAFYNAKAMLDGATVTSSGLVDSEGDIFNMITKLSNYNETQKALFLNVPIMAQFQTKKFYLLGGVKLGVPVKGKFSVTDATLTNSAYYPKYDNTLTEPAFAGLGAFPNINAEGKLPLQLSVALSLETGIKWEVGDFYAIYAGLYFDYGLNNITKPGAPFINYNSNEPANFTNNCAALYLTEKMNVLALGVKVRFAFIK